MSRTNNSEFDEKGYLAVPAMVEITEDFHRLEAKAVAVNFNRKPDGSSSVRFAESLQVGGSSERYNFPDLRDMHYRLKPIVEKHIGKKLLTTYYFDRVYYPGNELTKHVDRPACEISVSLHISTNMSPEAAAWPLQFEKDGVHGSVAMPNPGDAVIYKGDLVPHWRDPMPGTEDSDEYFHQVFFHYVLADGWNVEHAGDPGTC